MARTYSPPNEQKKLAYAELFKLCQEHPEFALVTVEKSQGSTVSNPAGPQFNPKMAYAIRDDGENYAHAEFDRAGNLQDLTVYGGNDIDQILILVGGEEWMDDDEYDEYLQQQDETSEQDVLTARPQPNGPQESRMAKANKLVKALLQ